MHERHYYHNPKYDNRRSHSDPEQTALAIALSIGLVLVLILANLATK